MSFLQISMKDNFSAALMKKLHEAGPKASQAVATEIARTTEPFVPALTKSLVNRTQAIDGMVIYPGPYARYLYYGKVMVDEHGHGPAHFIDKHGNEVIQFPKGARLHATDRNLVFTTSVHPNAQAHWFEASKSQNLEKWVDVAGKAVESELNE